MMGDTHGDVVKITKTRKVNGNIPLGAEIAHVKLDKSGKTLRFLLDDCKEV
jgi:hypothetical protein